MRVQESVRLFLQDVQLRLSAKTHSVYSGSLKTFVRMTGHKKTSKLKAKHVQAWLDREVYRYERKRKYAPDTQRIQINAYQQWQKWEIERGHLEGEVLKKIKKPTGRARERIPTRSEAAAILKAGTRDFRRIYRCLMYTGARPGELVYARIEDFDRDLNLIVLRQHKTAEKVGRVRKIGVGAKVRRILDRCIGERTEGLIFLTDLGRPWSPQGLSQKFRRTKLKAGVSADLVLYSARHAAGTAVCRKFGIRAAAHLLGHASITTTQRYTHPDDADLARYQDEAFRH